MEKKLRKNIKRGKKSKKKNIKGSEKFVYMKGYVIRILRNHTESILNLII